MKWISELLSVVILVSISSCQTGQAQDIRKVNGAELIELLENDNVQLVDVRTPEEVATGLIAGAEHIDIYDPAFEQKILLLDRNQPIAVYCAVGGRSASAAGRLKELGFKEIYDLKGGMRGWIAEGRAVSK